jgi:hypothetical protein
LQCQPKACWWRAVWRRHFLPTIGAVFAAKGVEMRCDAEALALLAVAFANARREAGERARLE